MARTSAGKPAQVAQALREDIAGMAAHEPLKGQRELAEEFGVALMTVRNALEQLHQEGLVYTVHGVGSFVSDRVISRRLELMSFTEEMRARGLSPSSELIEAVEIPADVSLKAKLRIAGDGQIYRITRLRRADAEPIALEPSFFDAAAFPELLSINFNESLYETLRDTYGRTVASADERVSAANLDQRQAKFLKVSTGAAALRIERTVFDTRGRAIEVSDSFRRADRYDIKYVLQKS